MTARDAAMGGGQGPGPAMPGTKPGTDHQVDHHEEHPGEALYIRVAIILAIVTAIEVAIYYIGFLEGVLVPLLIVLSIGKFIAVVGYFMHLKMDSKVFRAIFVAGLVLSLSVVLALMAMFWTDSYYMPRADPAESAAPGPGGGEPGPGGEAPGGEPLPPPPNP